MSYVFNPFTGKLDAKGASSGGAVATDAIWDAKGDLAVGTAANKAAVLASSGTAGNVLTVDTSTATGLKWAAPAGGGVSVLEVQVFS